MRVGRREIAIFNLGEPLSSGREPLPASRRTAGRRHRFREHHRVSVARMEIQSRKRSGCERNKPGELRENFSNARRRRSCVSRIAARF